MKGFIEVENINGNKVLVNIDYIIVIETITEIISQTEHRFVRFIYTYNLEPIKTLETYEEIKQKIEQAQGENK